MQLKTTSSLALAFALAIGSGAVFAQDMSKSGKPMTAQQSRMVSCNKEATGKTGADRKTFMSTCLKGDHAMASTAAAAPATGKMTQQQKMKSCNVDAKAKSLKGADRKAFMSTCLKGDSATAAAPAAAAAGKTASTKPTQQEKMKTCSADAKTKALKGADRKAFMSSCLKDDAAAH